MLVSWNELIEKQTSITVIGLGYVGLPLVVKLAEHFKVTGFDINQKRIDALKKGHDETLEVEPGALAESSAVYTSDPSCMADSKLIIVTVPTPVTQNKVPDLSPLEKASQTIGTYIQAGTVVVYESTVFPGATEEVCAPIIEKESGLQSGVDFYLGYSPERINPGDKVHTLETIQKVVSGQTPEVLELVARVYGQIIKAGIFKAADIRTAEAAKVIENTQRDVNISLINELALIFHRMGLRTKDVLDAAGTKWNFLRFQPGLVGGHCISVDPYYLVYKSQELGYEPAVITSGRRINDEMGNYVGRETVKQLVKRGFQIPKCKILILGITFKENIPDTRNSKVWDIMTEIADFGIEFHIHDPFAPEEITSSQGKRILEIPESADYDAVILVVPHKPYLEMGVDAFAKIIKEDGVFVDVKSCFEPEDFTSRRLGYWSL